MISRAAAARFLTILVLATLCATLTWPTSSIAQDGGNLSITKVDATHYPRIDIYVTAHSIPGAMVVGQPLAVHERIGESWQPVTATLEQDKAGVSVIVLVDLHRRMRGIGMPLEPDQPKKSLNRLDTARAAIMQLAQALTNDSPGINQLGVIAYHRDLIEVMPLQPLAPGLVESYIQPKGSRQRLFDIERKPRDSPANDPSDPHAKSALSLAVRAAADLLAAQAPANQQRVIVIIGTTCTDLVDELTDRTSVTCDSIDQTLGYVRQRARADLLTIYGVGVGSRDPKLPLVSPQDYERGFNYTANFNQIELLAGQPERFFVLHTADPSQRSQIWQGFARNIIAPIQNQATQLKVSFDALPAGTSQITTTIRLELQGRVLEAQFAAPQLDLLLNGTPVALDSIDLAPGTFELAARYTGAAAPTQTRKVQIIVPTPILPSPTAASVADPSSATSWLERASAYISLFAFLLAIVAVFYWLALGRSSPDSSQQRSAAPAADLTRQLSSEQRAQEQAQAIPAATRTTHFYLQQVLGPRPGEIYPIFDTPFSIGSACGSVHLCIDDPYISPRHATIDIVDPQLGVVTMTDNGSKNGTWVSGAQPRHLGAVAADGQPQNHDADRLAPNTPIVLKPNAQIGLGWVTFVYLYVEEPPEPGKRRIPARGETIQLGTVAASTSSSASSAAQNIANLP